MQYENIQNTPRSWSLRTFLGGFDLLLWSLTAVWVAHISASAWLASKALDTKITLAQMECSPVRIEED